MSIKLGTQDIAGISQNTKYNAHHLLDFKWTDCIMNDVSWLRADTFSWQEGTVYSAVYNELVSDISGATSATETISGTTITYYRTAKDRKVVLADQETNVSTIYNATGYGWYYVLDTTNERFKLPRTKWGFTGLRDNVGNYIEAGLPNITGTASTLSQLASGSGAFSISGGPVLAGTGYFSASGILNFNASNSNSIYGNNTTVQPPAVQMYLYFYVGDYSQTAIEQTAGLNSELFNNKLDIPHGRNQSSSGLLVDSYVNGTSWYRVYSDGWCEQGGITTEIVNTSTTVNLLKPYKDTNYSISAIVINDSSNVYADEFPSVRSYNSTQIVFVNRYLSSNVARPIMWRAKGYIS